ncbi:MAG TPA: aldehyde dehydrogenase family protein [Methanocorpusculum sp.]|nr:aldehyde dehydrogenase family protein [Methanocorpusculum sp.]
MPDTTSQLSICGSELTNTILFPDIKLQTLDSRVGKGQLFFDSNMFEQSVHDWNGIPIIFQKDGIHLTNFAAVLKDPAQASAAFGGSVWTTDIKTARRISAGLNAGVVWINKHLILPPELLFDGVGFSGYGRENGREFYQEYTYEKSILMGSSHLVLL